MHKCVLCYRSGNMDRHHVIHGKGKKKALETRQSKVFICSSCHKIVHSDIGQKLDLKLKLQLQAEYFKMGKTEDEIEMLMDGKLYLVFGEVWGKYEKHHQFEN